MKKEKLLEAASVWTLTAKNDIRERVINLKNEKELTEEELAEELGMSLGEIGQIICGNGDICLSTLAKLLVYFDLALEVKPVSETPIVSYDDEDEEDDENSEDEDLDEYELITGDDDDEDYDINETEHEYVIDNDDYIGKVKIKVCEKVPKSKNENHCEESCEKKCASDQPRDSHGRFTSKKCAEKCCKDEHKDEHVEDIKTKFGAVEFITPDWSNFASNIFKALGL